MSVPLLFVSRQSRRSDWNHHPWFGARVIVDAFFLFWDGYEFRGINKAIAGS